MKKKTIIIGALIISLTAISFGVYYCFCNEKEEVKESIINNNTKDDTSNNTNNETPTNECDKKVTSLNNEILSDSCEEYHFTIEPENIDIKAKLNLYDDSKHYTLTLTINNKNVTTDFFTNKDKKAIFGNVVITTHENYIIVKSDTTAQINGQYVAVINDSGKILFIGEDAMINIDGEDLTITRGSLDSFLCDCSKPNDSSVIETTTSYKIGNNSVVAVSTKKTTCNDECTKE